MSEKTSDQEILEAVRARYAQAARQVEGTQRASCCSSSSCCESSAHLYDPALLKDLPETAALASLGCGNPLLLAELKPGEVVLDLGSGGGIDVLLSARRVGPSGHVYGLDMTDEMLAWARATAAKAGAGNVEFLKGQIEAIPLPDSAVDVIISNCVINLSADKDAVLAEALRVLKPGGRFAVADIVVQGPPLAEPLRRALALWTSCISGALTEDDYRGKLAAAGFEGIEIQVLSEYSADDIPAELRCCAPPDLRLEPGQRVVSAFVKAAKPTA